MANLTTQGPATLVLQGSTVGSSYSWPVGIWGTLDGDTRFVLTQTPSDFRPRDARDEDGAHCTTPDDIGQTHDADCHPRFKVQLVSRPIGGFPGQQRPMRRPVPTNPVRGRIGPPVASDPGSDWAAHLDYSRMPIASDPGYGPKTVLGQKSPARALEPQPRMLWASAAAGAERFRSPLDVAKPWPGDGGGGLPTGDSPSKIGTAREGTLAFARPAAGIARFFRRKPPTRTGLGALGMAWSVATSPTPASYTFTLEPSDANGVPQWLSGTSTNSGEDTSADPDYLFEAERNTDSRLGPPQNGGLQISTNGDVTDPVSVTVTSHDFGGAARRGCMRPARFMGTLTTRTLSIQSPIRMWTRPRTTPRPTAPAGRRTAGFSGSAAIRLPACRWTRTATGSRMGGRASTRRLPEATCCRPLTRNPATRPHLQRATDGPYMTSTGGFTMLRITE